MFDRIKLYGALVVAAVLLSGGGLTWVPGRAGTAGPEISEALEACTVIMVGREASTDGSVMSTHAADCGVCDFTSVRNITFHPRGARGSDVCVAPEGIMIPSEVALQPRTRGIRHGVLDRRKLASTGFNRP